MGLDQLRSRIDNHQGSGALTVTLEEFFEGNDDDGSIGCNLEPVRGARHFYDALKALRARPDVQEVVVSVTDPMEDEDGWPFSDTVYVITSAPKAEVKTWAAKLGAGLNDGYLVAPKPEPTPREGHHPYSFWWD